METSLYVAYLDLFVAPLLLMLTFAIGLRKVPFLVRVGYGVLAMGLLAQSWAVLFGMDQLHGWGTMWALKDVGAAIMAFGYFCHVAYINRD